MYINNIYGYFRKWLDNYALKDYDNSMGMQPVKKSGFLIFLALVVFSITLSETGATLNYTNAPAIRKLPDKYTGGEIVVITIEVNPFLPHGARIIEKVPDGWDLVGANPPLTKQPFRNMFLWEIPAKGEVIKNIKYAVSIPKGNKSRKEFTGYVDIGKSVRLIVSGDRYIWGE